MIKAIKFITIINNRINKIITDYDFGSRNHCRFLIKGDLQKKTTSNNSDRQSSQKAV